MRLFAYNHILERMGSVLGGMTEATDQENSGNITVNQPVNGAPVNENAVDGNGIISSIKPETANKVSLTGQMVNEAQQAYVVSPVSSLVVLEKKEDYDRFNIQDNKNSLHNASLHSNGSAPEPSQWMLILIVIAALWYIRWTPASAKNKITN